MPDNLKQFRSAIAQAWLPLVGRKRLTSSEYALVKEWFAESIPVNVILRAILEVAKRGTVVYSLGVIKADLEAIRRTQGRMQAGAHTEATTENWRVKWLRDLEALVEEYPELTQVGFYLIQDLPEMTEAQAKARWQEITSQI
jgi:hypothetical protein